MYAQSRHIAKAQIMRTAFSQNLRFLCAEAPSIAQICREIGLNRQQFNRYLSGAGLPSAHNLRRIARHFDVGEADLFTDPDHFAAARRPTTAPKLPAPLLHIGAGFADQARPLRRFLGTYHGYFCTPTWPGQVLRSLIHLKEVDGYVVSHTFERAHASDGSIRQRSTYLGLVAERGGRLCLTERPRNTVGALSETILMPEHPHQISYLQGLVLGVSAGANRRPFSTRTVWVRLEEKRTAREALADVGALPKDSPRLDPKVRRLLGDELPLSLTLDAYPPC